MTRYGYAWRKVRGVVLHRDGWRCHWCGAPAVEVDHVRELDNGGTDHPSNLVASCRACNARRGAVYRVAKVRRATVGASRRWY